MTQSKASIDHELTVQRRTTAGTRPVRRMRRDGLIPGVVYGKSTEPLSIEINGRALTKMLQSRAGEHALVKLRMEGSGSWEKPVLVHDVQRHPVSGHILHVDFHAVALTERLRVKVPVVLRGEAVGVKQEGGLLEHFLREVEVECLPTDIPDAIEFDVTPLTIGQTIHVRDLTPPKNTKITSDADGAIASIQRPKEEQPAAVEAAVTEPEVIREKKEEAEGAEEAAPTEGGRPAKPAAETSHGAGEAGKGAKS